MKDPFALFGLGADAGDDSIRQRYLELVKAHPPERDAARFAAIREAYEQLRDWKTRLRARVFGVPGEGNLGPLIEDWVCRKPRRRFSLKQLQEATRTL